MSELKEICIQFASMTNDERTAFLVESATRIIPVMNAVLGSAAETARLYTAFVVAAVSSDGKLARNEYETVQPLLELVVGKSVSWETIETMLAQDRASLKVREELAALIVSRLPQELKREFVMSALCICAADGKVSASELDWVAALV